MTDGNVHVEVCGEDLRAEARRRAINALPGVAAAEGARVEEMLANAQVLFVAGPTSGRFRLAEAAAKRGVHVFLEWPPALSIHEGEALVRFSEEAGVEMGVSRPLRFHPALAAQPKDAPADVVLIQQRLGEAASGWTEQAAEALDLCCALAGSESVRRIDARAVRDEGAHPVAVAFGLRFHSGTHAQVQLRRGAEGTLYAAGPGFELEMALDGASLVEAETQAFVEAVRDGRPAPVSILSALHTIRLTERLMERLR